MDKILIVILLSLVIGGCNKNIENDIDKDIARTNDVSKEVINESPNIEDYMIGDFVDDKYFSESEELKQFKKDFYDYIKYINEEVYVEFESLIEITTWLEDEYEFDDNIEYIIDKIYNYEMEILDRYDGVVLSREMNAVKLSINHTLKRGKDLLSSIVRIEDVGAIIEQSKDVTVDSTTSVFAYVGYIDGYNRVNENIEKYY